MHRYPRIYDKDLRLLGDLRTATVRDLTLCMTPLSHVTLEAPAQELGGFGYRQFVELFNASGERIDLFRVSEIPKKKYGPAGTVTLECDQALCTLRDDILPGYTQLGGTTQNLRGALEAILAAQRVRRWQLGRCELDGNFEYGFSDEGLLSALMMALEPFTDFMIETDTTTAPWTLHVVRLSDEDATELRYSRNLLEVTETVQDEGFATRLYPRGYGEGVNQLNIREVNGGIDYIEAPQAVRDAFGDVSLPFIDTTITDAATLLAKARAELEICQTPQVSYGVTAADLSMLTGEPMDRFTPGHIVRAIYHEYGLVIRTRLMEMVYPDPIGSPGDVKLTLSSLRETAASVIAGLEKKARITELYGQGSTFIYADTIEQNADVDTPAEGDIYIPENMVHVNAVMLKVSVSAFRADSKGAAAGGKTTRTSSSGGASTQTSSEGGASERTSSSGGGTTVTVEQKALSTAGSTTSLFGDDGGSRVNTDTPNSDAGFTTGSSSPKTGNSSLLTTDSGGGESSTGEAGDHLHSVNSHHHSISSGATSTGNTAPLTSETGSHRHKMAGHTHGMQHTHTVNSHTHPIGSHTHGMSHGHTVLVSVTVPSQSIQIKNHTHTVSIPAHSHSVSIPAHTHDVEIPDHSHGIVYGIYKGPKAAAYAAFVDGVRVPDGVFGSDGTGDIAPYLSKDEDGRIRRGVFHTLAIRPLAQEGNENGLCHIRASWNAQAFISSLMGVQL